MATVEDNLRARVQQAEAELRHGRCQLIQYLKYDNGKFGIDPRYSGQFAELQQREKRLITSIDALETAMERAIERTKDVAGITFLAGKFQTWTKHLYL